jgi:hypothetical protein
LVSTQAGKNNHFHITALGDVLAANLGGDAKDAWRKQAVQQMFDRAVSEQIFDWVVVDQVNANWLPYYLYTGPVVENNGAMYPVTKTSMIPESVMIKNPVAHGGSLPFGDVNFERYFVEGWGEAQDWGRWAVGPTSAVQVAMEKKHDYLIKIEVEPACEDGKPVLSRMSIDWNGETLGTLVLPACQRQVATFDLYGDKIKKDFNRLQFLWGETSPAFSLNQEAPLAEPQAAFYEITFIQK